jgi:hypothetical protein
MGLALMLEQSPLIGVPGIGLHASAIINGQAGVISDFGTTAAFGSVFVDFLAPFAGEIDLGGE